MLRVLFLDHSIGTIKNELHESLSQCEFIEIANVEQLKSQIQECGNEKNLFIIDLDLISDELSSIDDSLNRSHSKKIYSSDKLNSKQFKEIQKSGVEAEAFLKRPHDLESLLDLLKDIGEDWNTDALNEEQDSLPSSSPELTLQTEIDTSLTESLSQTSGEGGSLELAESDSVELSLEGSESYEVEASSEDMTTAKALEEDFSLPDELTDITSDIDDHRGELNQSTATMQNNEQSLNLTETDLNLNEEQTKTAMSDDLPAEKSETEATSMTEVFQEAEQSLSIPTAELKEESSMPIHFNSMEELAKSENAIENELIDATESETMVYSGPLSNNAETDFIGQEVVEEKGFTEQKSSQEDEKVYEEIFKDELLKLKATIQTLREDRDLLDQQKDDLEKENQDLKLKLNRVVPDFEELKIEFNFIKNRFAKDNDEMKSQTQDALAKRDLLLDRNKQLKLALDSEKNKIKLDVKKAHEKERVLEGQLEMLRSDSESLIKTRDQKIIELKRKIDSLEFDLESLSENEKRSRKDKVYLEEKLNRIMSTLRRTIGTLDEEIISERVGDPDKDLPEL